MIWSNRAQPVEESGVGGYGNTPRNMCQGLGSEGDRELPKVLKQDSTVRSFHFR